MAVENIKEVVKEKYGQAALRVTSGAGNPCCRDDPSTLEGSCDPITSNLYDAPQEGEVPDTAIKASLGCGNPTTLAKLKSDEIVLDLGSGGGIDVLLQRFGCSNRAAALPSPMLLSGVTYLPKLRKAWSFGWAASPAP